MSVFERIVNSKIDSSYMEVYAVSRLKRNPFCSRHGNQFSCSDMMMDETEGRNRATCWGRDSDPV